MLRSCLCAVLAFAAAACSGTSSSQPLPPADSSASGAGAGSSSGTGSTFDDPSQDIVQDLGEPDPNRPMTMVLTLVQGHPDGAAAYDPTHDPTCASAGPDASAIATLVKYFQNDGLKEDAPTGCVAVSFSGTASEIAESLQVQIHLFSRNGVTEADIVSNGTAPRTIARAIEGIDLRL